MANPTEIQSRMKLFSRHIHHADGTHPAEAILPNNNLADPKLYPGHVGLCECGKRMFFPDLPGHHPVEVEDKLVG